jgi:hypothetical protein
MDRRVSCDLCGTTELNTMFDGKVQGGTRWANMCKTCFELRGCGLGTGKGQKYIWKDGTFYSKIAG